jgi:tRNA (adenine9-N1/guanine9-N1)-methyltransferase
VLLKSLLAKELKERGIYSLFIGHEKPSLQTLAVKMLVKGYGIVKGEREGNVVAEEEGIKLLKV